MGEPESVGAPALSNADLARVLSPLLLFLAHVVYLAFWSPEPFLNKWLDGSFSFFLALVLCNIVRARVVAAHPPPGTADDTSEGGPGDDGAGTASPPEVHDGAGGGHPGSVGRRRG